MSFTVNQFALNEERNRPAMASKFSTTKWGDACSACSAAKAKCSRLTSTTSSKCDRCDRLSKTCTARVSRPRKKRLVRPSRISQIEGKLNTLATLLKDGQGQLLVDDAADKRTGSSVTSRASTQDETLSRERGQGDEKSLWSIPDTYNLQAPPSCTCRAEFGEAPPPPETDEALLDIYRNEMLPNHPFVVIPLDETAESLTASRPFLMSAIRMVASTRSPRSTRAQMCNLMKEISERMLIQCERSMDLLLGIIVIVGYYQYHCFTHAQLNNLIGLAMVLVGELGISDPPFCNPIGTRLNNVRLRTNEERRVLAGVWFISSSMSLAFGKIDSMRYTRYLDECIKELESSPEYESDVTLVHLIRVQHLTYRIKRCTSQGNRTEEMPIFPVASVARHDYVSAFEAELEHMRQELPERLRKDKIFQTYLNTATLRLYEPPILDGNLINMFSTSTQPSLDEIAASPLDEFYQSHSALTAWFDNWLSVPVSAYSRQSATTCSLVIYAISLLGRWAALMGPSALFKKGSPESRDSSGTPLSASYADDHSSYKNYLSGTNGSPALSISLPTPATSNSSPASSVKPCHYSHPNATAKLGMDLPAAVSSLQTRLNKHSGLHVDVLGVLEMLQSRFHQVGASMQRFAVKEERQEQNVWSVSSMRVFLKRTKLERWGANAVAAPTGPEATEATEVEKNVVDEGDMDNFEDTGGMGMDLLNDGVGMEWSFMPDIDGTAWFGGCEDWGVDMMGSMGYVGYYDAYHDA